MKSSSTTNPFRTLLATVVTDSWQPVTLDLLNKVAEIVNVEETFVVTYGESFKVLEFLAQAGAVLLEPEDPKSPQVYKIKKVG